MSWDALGDRARQVLQAVIFEYIVTAEPVGSRQVAKKYALGLSPATIRNTMADLEEMGFLTHPHTSAGRVPTDKAYRFYVDTQMGGRPIARNEALHLQRQVAGARADIDDLMESTSAQLSALSHYAAVILAPPLRQTRLERIDLIAAGTDRALVVLATETGWGTSRILTLEESVSPAELAEVARLLTEEYSGRSFQEIRDRVTDATVPADADRLARLCTVLARKVFASLWDRNLYYSGAMNILDQPEFADIATMKAILRTFEEKRQLIELLTARASAQDGVQVVIGSEMPYQEMQETSLVAASYKYGDRVLGVLGVVGPRRMPYAKIVPLVDYTARLVSRRLTRAARAEPFA
ncbi:MAG TPA: heat-inducible transcriptional repressor HrcA [Methylomirabilota bacterium]|jgi:heat-inducible transcriptional repressor|nr:heat-inducible transcriptional repressor HrcA [Methylomirabilota bacterium]